MSPGARGGSSALRGTTAGIGPGVKMGVGSETSSGAGVRMRRGGGGGGGGTAAATVGRGAGEPTRFAMSAKLGTGRGGGGGVIGRRRSMWRSLSSRGVRGAAVAPAAQRGHSPTGGKSAPHFKHF